MFVAQAAGIDMPLSQQILMMLTLMVTSKGVAAVPRASLVILSGALTQFGLPLSGVALILGVDAVMDMARTSINLVGNCLATAVMARWEGELKAPGTVLSSRAGSTDHGERAVNLTTLMQAYVFVLAGFVGFLVIARVPPLLHTPLMSATNAISGISLVGSLVAAGAGRSVVSTVLGTIAVTDGDDQRRRRIHHHPANARHVQAERSPSERRTQGLTLANA